MFLPLMSRHKIIGAFKYTEYDLELYGCAGAFLEKAETKKYIEAAIKGNFFGVGVMNKNNKDVSSNALFINAPNLSEVLKMIPKTLFIDYDINIINNEKGVLLSYGIARALSLEVGDTIRMHRGTKTYILAGIFENCVARAFENCHVIALDKGFEDIPYYTRAYVKLNDYDNGLKYFNDTYMRHKDLYRNGIINWENVSEEVKEQYRKDSFTTRALSLRMAEDEYNEAYNRNELIIKAVLSIIALFTTDIYTYYKHAKINRRKFATLRACGIPKYKIFIYYILLSFIEQAIMLFCAMFFIRSVPLSGAYISTALLLSWIGIFALILISASLVSGIVALYNVRDSVLLQSIQEDKV